MPLFEKRARRTNVPPAIGRGYQAFTRGIWAKEAGQELPKPFFGRWRQDLTAREILLILQIHLLRSAEEDLSTAAADHLALTTSYGDGLHGLAGGTAEVTLGGAVTQTVADALLPL